MLERIALHQTRLRTPGLGLEAKGVALGAKGLLLLPALDRLVALLALYTRERSLEDLLPSLALHVVRSKLGTREVVVEFAAESSDRMDRLADTARLVGGFTFTGTSRHFVQYRDAAAPFGYDATDLLVTGEALALYHQRFTQTYEVERALDLKALLLRLMLQPDPATRREAGPRLVVAEQGLGPALLHYLARSRVDADVCTVEWPPASALDDGPVLRTLARIPDVPPRMVPLLTSTPGLTTFLTAGSGVAVEIGYRHPVELRACPVFDGAGLFLLRGRGDEPWAVPRLPPMGPVRAFTRVELRTEEGAPRVAVRGAAPGEVRVPLRLVPSLSPNRHVTAAWVPQERLPLLRRLAYLLPQGTLGAASVALTSHGAFLRAPKGIEAIPLGMFFREVHPGLFTPAGHDVIPQVAPTVLRDALGLEAGHVTFVTPEARAFTLEEGAFVPLERALLEAPPLEPLLAEGVEEALEEELPDLRLEPLGAFALRSVEDR